MQSQTPQLKHYTLQAGAGAGKTKSLIDEIFQSAQNHYRLQGQFPKIIATTFTKKATAEVKERLMAKAIQDHNWPLLEFIGDPSKMFVSTLHGIIYTFLKTYHKQDDIEIMSDHQKISLARPLVREILSENKMFFHLLQYRFHVLIQMFLDYDAITRYNPDLKPLTLEEATAHWISCVKKLLQRDLSSPDDFLSAVIKDPLKISSSEKIIEHLKNHNAEKETQKELKELVEKFHPDLMAKEWSNTMEVFYSACEIFKTRWRNKKLEQNLIQIEDLELTALDLIRKNPSALESFSKDWDFWFIDEYQDISPFQEEILNHFTDHAKKVWVVGDPQQSIYFFRGADPDVFERRKTKSHVKEKNTNYRADFHIVSFLNDLFKNYFQPMKSHHSPVAQKTSAQFLMYGSADTEEEAVAQRLNEWFDRKIPPGKIGILLRTNKDVSYLGRALKKLKFPVQAHTSKDFKRENRDLLFLLRFLINPFDNQNLIGLLRTPYFYMSDEQITGNIKKNQSLWPELSRQSDLDVVKNLNHLIQKSQQWGYSETLLYALRKHLMIDLCFFQDPTQSGEFNLWKLITDLKNKENTFQFRHSQFIEDYIQNNQFYNLDESVDSLDPIHPDFIQIMTVHQSKGLEFDHIIIPKMDKPVKLSEAGYLSADQNKWYLTGYNENGETLYPLEKKLWKKKKQESELAELDRLFYVAVTRAKKSLTFIYPENFFSKNKTTLKKTWLGRFSYFSKVFDGENLSSEPVSGNLDSAELSLSQIIPIHSEYSIEIRRLQKLKNYSCIASPAVSANSLKPYCFISKEKKIPSIHPSQKETFFANIHTLQGSVRGQKLHELMYKLKKQNKDKNQVLLSLTDEEQKFWKPVIDYVLNLKQPPMQILLREGCGEWSYVYEEKNQKFQGRIDLWGEAENKIWIVDYKSGSAGMKKQTQEQLQCYGKALQKKYPEKEVRLCAIWPLDGKCEMF